MILKAENGEIYKELKLDKMPINAIFVNKQLWIGQRDKEDSKIFEPHQYALEGKQENWWLTAPKGKDCPKRLL